MASEVRPGFFHSQGNEPDKGTQPNETLAMGRSVMGLNYALLPLTGWEWLGFWPKWKTGCEREEGEGKEEAEGEETKGKMG